MTYMCRRDNILLETLVYHWNEIQTVNLTLSVECPRRLNTQTTMAENKGNLNHDHQSGTFPGELKFRFEMYDTLHPKKYLPYLMGSQLVPRT